MVRPALLTTCVCGLACGRIAFDRVPGQGWLDRDARDDDAFVRGDVVFANNVAFVTEPVVVPGMLGSVAPADAACQDAATAAGLPGTYVAWLSSTESNAIDRIAGSRGWVRADGLPFVDQLADLTAGRALSPLAVGGDGAAIASTAVVTATTNSGIATVPNCTNLTSPSGSISFGLSTATGNDWTAVSFPFLPCADPQRLYCFGNGGTNPVVVPDPGPARRAFVSTPWTPGAGLTSADTRCAADATAAGLTGGTFRAALATSTTSAASRFIDGLPWKRLDGMLLAPTAAAVLSGNLTVPLNVDLMGNYLIENQAWLGAATVTETGTVTCLDWSVSNNGNDGVARVSDRLDPPMQLIGCGNARPLFCLED